MDLQKILNEDKNYGNLLYDCCRLTFGAKNINDVKINCKKTHNNFEIKILIIL